MSQGLYKNIFDSHAHYNDERFLDDQDEVIKMIQKQGVCNVINAGCDDNTNKSSIELTKKYPMFYCSVGYHPEYAGQVEDDYISRLEELAKNEKVVAIGETGLDYHYDDGAPADVQKIVFEQQLILAKKLDMPVIIHSREATKDTLELLEKYRPKGVVHCFSGSAETAKRIVGLGMYLGFTGVVTFGNAKKALEAVAQTPIDRILLETDCPYMAPTPRRGKRCTSDLIEYIAIKIAEIKGVDVQTLINTANENTHKCFELPL